MAGGEPGACAFQRAQPGLALAQVDLRFGQPQQCRVCGIRQAVHDGDIECLLERPHGTFRRACFLLQETELDQVGGHALPVRARLHALQGLGEIAPCLLGVAHPPVGHRDAEDQRLDFAGDVGLSIRRARALEVEHRLGLLAQQRLDVAAGLQRFGEQLLFLGVLQQGHHLVDLGQAALGAAGLHQVHRPAQHGARLGGDIARIAGPAQRLVGVGQALLCVLPAQAAAIHGAETHVARGIVGRQQRTQAFQVRLVALAGRVERGRADHALEGLVERGLASARRLGGFVMHGAGGGRPRRRHGQCRQQDCLRYPRATPQTAPLAPDRAGTLAGAGYRCRARSRSFRRVQPRARASATNGGNACAPLCRSAL